MTTFENFDSNKLKDLEYYTKLARNQIMKFAGPIGKKMLKDEQAVGDVVNEIMLAELKHDPLKGRTRKSWLNQHAIYAIYDYINASKRLSKHNHSELNEDITGDEATPLDYENKEMLRHLFEHCELSERQRYCVEKHYLEEHSLKEIAEHLGICRWAVTLNIRAALAKLKKASEVYA